MLAFILGGTLGVLRILQGGHFLSDILFSALLMWFVAIALEKPLLRELQTK